MKQLYQFVGPMRELVYSDPYKLSSIITLLDMSVGSNKKLTSTERVSVYHFLSCPVAQSVVSPTPRSRGREFNPGPVS